MYLHKTYKEQILLLYAIVHNTWYKQTTSDLRQIMGPVHPADPLAGCHMTTHDRQLPKAQRCEFLIHMSPTSSSNGFISKLSLISTTGWLFSKILFAHLVHPHTEEGTKQTQSLVPKERDRFDMLTCEHFSPSFDFICLFMKNTLIAISKDFWNKYV